MEAHVPGKANGVFFEARQPVAQGFGEEMRRVLMTASPERGEKYFREWQEEGQLFAPKTKSVMPDGTHPVR